MADETKKRPGDPDHKFTDAERQKLGELEKLWGQIAPFKVRTGLLVFRKAKRGEWHRYKADPKKVPPLSFDEFAHDENFIRAMVCLGDVEPVLDDGPALHDLFLEACKALANGTDPDFAYLGKDWKTPDATT